MIDAKQFGGTDQAIQDLLGRQQALRSGVSGVQRSVTDRRPIPKHERGGRFVRGPIPFDWLQAALAFGGKAGNLAWALWWLVGMKDSNPIRVTRQVLHDFHISTRAARRLLRSFERAGLIEVDTHRGRCPIVTLLPVRFARDECE